MSVNKQKLNGLLGLAFRAGAVAAGGMQVEKALLSGRCRLLIIAVDTAADTQKKLISMAVQSNTSHREVLTKIELGCAVGKSPKAALAVTQEGFAATIDKLISAGIMG